MITVNSGNKSIRIMIDKIIALEPLDDKSRIVTTGVNYIVDHDVSELEEKIRNDQDQ